MKEIWTLHIDLISQPNGNDPDSSVNLHLAFPSQQEMHNFFNQYHDRVGETIGISGQYTILNVEPDLFPVKVEGVDENG